MRKLIILLLSLTAFISYAQPKPAYSIFTSEGKETDYGKMLKVLLDADIIFIGETHNCPISHWLEYEIASDVIKKSPKGLVLGAEMFESDNQLLVDEYTQGLISSDKFEAEAKLWDNYWTDYASLLFLAREHGLKFVATNVPRRYASYVKDNGLEALQSLSENARSLMAPLPIPYDKAVQDEAMFGFMQMMGGKNSGKSYFAEAQAIKDATMAWFISQNYDKKFIHFNGNFHSDNKGGIIPYLEQYLPGKTIVTICSARQDSLNSLEKENRGRADFVVVAPTDFPMSY
jgi:uncharacterized iron-regulated protein